MKMLLAVLVGIMAVSGVMAGSKPIQVSVTPDFAVFDKNETIEGVIIGIWSENPQTALALGIVNGSRGQSAGLSWAFVLNYADDYTGIQWAPINYTKGDFFGWQGGFVNYAGRLTGLQLGFINYAETVETGIQIGLINIMPKNQLFTGLPDELAPGMVLVNWHF